MKQPVIRELYAYWSRLKGARLAPERNDIDLGAIRHLLAYAFIVQADQNYRFPLKMCGTRLNAFWLENQNGRSFLELWAPQDREAAASALFTVMHAVTPVVVAARGGAPDLTAVDLELLLLPLRRTGKAHSFVLGALTPSDHPDWLGRASIEKLRLNSLQMVGNEERRAAVRIPHVVSKPVNAVRPRLVVHVGGRS